MWIFIWNVRCAMNVHSITFFHYTQRERKKTAPSGFNYNMKLQQRSVAKTQEKRQILEKWPWLMVTKRLARVRRCRYLHRYILKKWKKVISCNVNWIDNKWQKLYIPLVLAHSGCLFHFAFLYYYCFLFFRALIASVRAEELNASNQWMSSRHSRRPFSGEEITQLHLEWIASDHKPIDLRCRLFHNRRNGKNSSHLKT